MPNTVTSPNMTIVVPVASVELGPAWATELQTALYSTVDAHDHSSTKGVQVTPAGLNINADLAFGSNNATTLRTCRFVSQGATLALGTDIGCLYNVNGDAYWNNGSGTAIQLTKNGKPNAPVTGWATKAVSGTYTILSSDTFALYEVSVQSAPATINLPASSALANGNFYLLLDTARNSETNPITVVPNGTDTINGVNASLAWSQNGATLWLTTDGAGHWWTTYASEGYERASGLLFPSSATFTIGQSAPTSDVATHSLTLAPQAAFSGASVNTASGDLLIALPASVGGGLAPRVKVTQGGSNLFSLTKNGRVQGSTFTCLYFGTAVDSESTTDYTFAGDGNVVTLNAPTGVGVSIGNATQLSITPNVFNFFPGTVSLQSAGTTVAAITPGGLAITNSSGPTLTSGTGAPASTPPNGSVYLRTDGTGATTVYERAGGAWSPLVSNGLAAPLATTVRTTATSTSYDATTPDALIVTNQAGPITVTLPAPTAGRTLFLADKSGNAQSNAITLARSSTEKINGLAASLVLTVNNGFWTIMSDGTDWYVS